MTCVYCGASDGLRSVDLGLAGLRFIASKTAHAICCLGPEDPWLPALRRRIPGSVKLRAAS